MTENLSLENKTVKNTKNNRANKKNVTGVNSDVSAGFLGELVKFLRQQCSWLEQRRSVTFTAVSVFFRNVRRKIQLF